MKIRREEIDGRFTFVETMETQSKILFEIQRNNWWIWGRRETKLVPVVFFFIFLEINRRAKLRFLKVFVLSQSFFKDFRSLIKEFQERRLLFNFRIFGIRQNFYFPLFFLVRFFPFFFFLLLIFLWLLLYTLNRLLKFFVKDLIATWLFHRFSCYLLKINFLISWQRNLSELIFLNLLLYFSYKERSYRRLNY